MPGDSTQGGGSGREAAPARRAGDSGRSGRLTRELVLSSALELVDREGLHALSMRRLGAELGVEAMSLYRYAQSKEALLDGLVEAMHLELHERLAAETDADTATTRGAPPWRSDLHRIARAMYDVCLAHPRAVPLLTTRMLATPMARRPLPVLRSDEQVLTLLREAVANEADTVTAFHAFTAWLLGYISVELRPLVDNPEESDPVSRFGLHLISAQELPAVRATVPALARRSGPESMAVGLDALLSQFAQGDPPTAST